MGKKCLSLTARLLKSHVLCERIASEVSGQKREEALNCTNPFA